MEVAPLCELSMGRCRSSERGEVAGYLQRRRAATRPPPRQLRTQSPNTALQTAVKLVLGNSFNYYRQATMDPGMLNTNNC